MSDFHLSDSTTKYNQWLHSNSLDSMRQRALDSANGCSCEILCVESSIEQIKYFSIVLCIIEKKHSVTDLLSQVCSVKNEVNFDWSKNSPVELLGKASKDIMYTRKDDIETSCVVFAGRGLELFKKIFSMYWCLKS